MEQQEIPAGTYPMRVVTRLSGLAPATIRAWERRYGAVVPDRTEGNARRYSADQVRRLVLLREAVERGHAIGDIAALPLDRLRELAEPVPTPEAGGALADRAHQQLLEDYLRELQVFNGRAAMDLLARTGALLPPRELVFGVLLPLLREVGDRWERGELNVAHEHLMSGHLKGLLSTLVRLQGMAPGRPKVMLATPPGQLHEFGALIGAFVTAGRELEPVYLGPDMPWKDLGEAVAQGGVELVVLSVIHDMEPGEAQELERQVAALADRIDVWIGLAQDHPLADRDLPVRFLHRFEDLDAALLHRSG